MEKEILGLLNATANDLVPELKLEFFWALHQPTIVTGCICLGGNVAFDVKEIKHNKNNAQLNDHKSCLLFESSTHRYIPCIKK